MLFLITQIEGKDYRDTQFLLYPELNHFLYVKTENNSERTIKIRKEDTVICAIIHVNLFTTVSITVVIITTKVSMNGFNRYFNIT